MKDLVDKLKLLEDSAEMPLHKDALTATAKLPSMSKPGKYGEPHPAKGKLVGGESVEVSEIVRSPIGSVFPDADNTYPDDPTNMHGKKCLKCRKGTYQETSIHDDWDGVQHCNKCGHEVKSHQDSITESNPKVESLYQGMKDAYLYGYMKARPGIVAVNTVYNLHKAYGESEIDLRAAREKLRQEIAHGVFSREPVTEDEKWFPKVIEAIQAAVPVVEEIWFHGSRAIGKAKKKSDWDILAIVPASVRGGPYVDVVMKLHKIEEQFPNFDIQPDHPNGMVVEIAREEGKLLWSKNKDTTITEDDLEEEMLHSRIKKQFLDFLSAPEEKSPKQKGKEAIAAADEPKEVAEAFSVPQLQAIATHKGISITARNLLHRLKQSPMPEHDVNEVAMLLDLEHNTPLFKADLNKLAMIADIDVRDLLACAGINEAKLGGAFEITVPDIFHKAGGEKAVKQACKGKSAKYAMKYLEAYVRRAIWSMRHKASHVSFRGWPEIEKWCKRNFRQVTESFLTESGGYFTGYELNYRGVNVSFDQDSDGFYWINYNPPLPSTLDKQYNKGTSTDDCARKARKAIDLLGHPKPISTYDDEDWGTFDHNVEEDISHQDLNYVQDIANSLWNELGIDINFTKHFFDRVNDDRNRQPITVSELINLFRKEYTEYGEKIKDLDPRSEAVMNDLFTKINIPFVIQTSRKGDEKDLVAKTVMRKPDFKTSDPKYQVEDIDEGFFGQGRKRARETALVESNDIAIMSKIINENRKN